jgi:HEPN domain-containing protein
VKPATERWLKIAEGDLAMAVHGFDDKLFGQCIFHCQQALEKVLKGLWIERSEELMPPRTHNLPRLAREAGLALSEDQFRFLQRLSEQYLPTRYGYLDSELPEEAAISYHEQTKEMFEWLRQQLT